MQLSRRTLKAAGAALCQDYPHARLVVLSRQGALNTASVTMMRDLYRNYIDAPHRDPGAVYVMRGEGEKAFCSGGDIVALTDAKNGSAYREEYFGREYAVDLHIATSPRTQVALWRGHVLGSGVGLSLHGRYRVACETTNFGMPETTIGTMPDVGTSWFFSHLQTPALGAYMALTGATLRGADVYHAGCATHYVAAAQLKALEEKLLAVNTADEVAPLLQQYMSESGVPPPSFAAELPVVAETFTVTPETTLQGIMDALQKASRRSSFAKMALARMEHNSPSGMTVALENFKMQSLFGPKDIAHALYVDLNLIENGPMLDDFPAGVHALLVARTKERPLWRPASIAEVSPKPISDFLIKLLSSRNTAEEYLQYKEK